MEAGRRSRMRLRRLVFFFLVEYVYFCSQYVQVTVMLLIGGAALRATHEPCTDTSAVT